MQIARSPLKVHVLSFCKRLQQEVCPITGPTQLEKNLIRFAFQVSKTTNPSGIPLSFFHSQTLSKLNLPDPKKVLLKFPSK